MSNPQMGAVIPTPILKRLSGETRRLSKINICVPKINTLAFNVEKLIVSHRFQRAVARRQYRVVERTNKRIHFANYRRPICSQFIAPPPRVYHRSAGPRPRI